uniref:Secreted protein n=1 Tax=Bursaphelenchus xylophilus TaxID=6326 RepID=A0A1I7SJ30_BURXY
MWTKLFVASCLITVASAHWWRKWEVKAAGQVTCDGNPVARATVVLWEQDSKSYYDKFLCVQKMYHDDTRLKCVSRIYIGCIWLGVFAKVPTKKYRFKTFAKLQLDDGFSGFFNGEKLSSAQNFSTCCRA